MQWSRRRGERRKLLEYRYFSYRYDRNNGPEAARQPLQILRRIHGPGVEFGNSPPIISSRQG